MHVVLLELAIDPTCSLVFEGEPSDAAAMRRPPRRRDEPLFGPRQILLALVQGASLLAAVLGLYVWALGRVPESEARGAAFLALVVGNLVLALTNVASTGRVFAAEHRIFWGISASVGVVLAAILSVPTLARLFVVAPPPASLLSQALAAAIVGAGWTGLLRLAPRGPDRWIRRPSPAA
jgi:Ca2+-transporting ATPase